jgi:hypothetical protein
MRPFLGIGISAILLAACETTAPTPNPDGASGIVPALAVAFTACDLDKVSSLYSATAEFLAPDTPMPVLGRAAVTRHLSGACTSAYKPLMRVLEQRVYPLGREGAVVSGSFRPRPRSQGHDQQPVPVASRGAIQPFRRNGAARIAGQCLSCQRSGTHVRDFTDRARATLAAALFVGAGLIGVLACCPGNWMTAFRTGAGMMNPVALASDYRERP